MRLSPIFPRLIFVFGLQVAAQTLPQPQPDILLLSDDEKLIGHFVRSNGSSVVFKSDLLGEVTVDWAKVKELLPTGRYAVVEKNVKLERRADVAKVPRGSLEVSNQTITLHLETGPTQTIPVAQSAHVMDAGIFEEHIEHRPGFTEAWNGTATAAATLVQATQQSRAFSGAISLVRTVPIETWLPPRNRTLIDFSAARGSLTQPNTPKVKTEIWHASGERDQYFSGHRLYGFGQTLFDHNFSQGLDLMQNYGGGLGWTAIEKPSLTLDLKGGISYIKQQFQIASQDHNLVASTFSETLTRRFTRGVIFAQQISVTPTWNELGASLASGGASYTAPVYKRLSFHIGLVDNYLHSPPVGFKRNSFQATTGLTYSLR
jgi:hypothetical protein